MLVYWVVGSGIRCFGRRVEGVSSYMMLIKKSTLLVEMLGRVDFGIFEMELIWVGAEEGRSWY